MTDQTVSNASGSNPQAVAGVGELKTKKMRPARDGNVIRQLSKLDEEGYPAGGVVAEEVTDTDGKIQTLVHIGNPYDTEAGYVTLVSRAPKAEIEAIRDKTIWTREFCSMFHFVAQARQASWIPILEGPSALGKNMVYDRFCQVLNGEQVKPREFYCHRQTEAMEIVGRWVPVLENISERNRVMALLSRPEFGGTGVVPGDKRTEAQLKEELSALAVRMGLSSEVKWRFEPGDLPSAMIMTMGRDGKATVDLDNPGPGHMFHVQEVGLAKTAVLNLFLECGGDNGELAPTIQLNSFGGRVLRGGADFFLCFSNNPADGAGFHARNDLDPALIARCAFWRYSENDKRSKAAAGAKAGGASGLCQESCQMAARRFMRFQVGNRPEGNLFNSRIDFSKDKALSGHLADAVALIHYGIAELVDAGEQGGRRQTIGVTLRDMARLADYMLRYQLPDSSGKGVDMVETLKTHVDDLYVKRIADPATRKTARQIVNKVLLGDLFKVNDKALAQVISEAALPLAAKLPAPAAPGRNDAITYLAKPKTEKEIRDEMMASGTGLVIEELVNAATQEKTVLLHFGDPFALKEAAGRSKAAAAGKAQAPEFAENRDTSIVTIASRADRKDIEILRNNIVWFPEFCDLMLGMAKSFSPRFILINEGHTSIGKSYAFNRFVNFVMGRDSSGKWIRPEIFYCNKHTEASEMLGQFVPDADGRQKREEAAKRILASRWGQSELNAIRERLAESNDLSPEDRELVFEAEMQRLMELIMRSGRGSFKWQAGSIGRAMEKVVDTSAVGVPIAVEEVGLAHPGVMSLCLALRGEHGRVTKKLQLGDRYYKALPYFWAVFNTNPPEYYLERQEVDQALVSGAIFHRQSGGLSELSFKMLAGRFMAYSVGNRPLRRPLNCALPIYEHEEMCKMLGEIAGEIHCKFLEEFEGEQISLKDRQLVAPNIRDLGKLAAYVLRFQALDSLSGQVDLGNTLRAGVRRIYIERIKDQDLKDKVEKHLDSVLKKQTTSGGVSMTREEALQKLVRGAGSAVLEVDVGPELREMKDRSQLVSAEDTYQAALDSLASNGSAPDIVLNALRRRATQGQAAAQAVP